MQETKQSKNQVISDDIKTMFEAGAHYGYSKSSRHPSVLKFIFGFKNKSAIINLEKTKDSLAKAKDFAKEKGAKGGQILLVGNKPEARKIIKDIAEKYEMPYVAERWMGGTFTNFKQIRKRVERLKEIRQSEQSGELARKFKKKERVKIAKEKMDLERYFEGILSMEKIPSLVFLIDPDQEKIALNESKMLSVPIIALASSDCDIRDVDYPIVANDSSVKSIKLFTEEIAKSFMEGKREEKESVEKKEEDKA